MKPLAIIDVATLTGNCQLSQKDYLIILFVSVLIIMIVVIRLLPNFVFGMKLKDWAIPENIHTQPRTASMF